MILVLLRNNARIAANKIFSYRFHSRLKGVVIGVFLLTYLVGGYCLLHEGFTFIQSFMFVGEMLMDRILEIFFFTLFFMILTSQALFAYGAYFRSKETNYLRTLPVSADTLFAWEFWQSLLLSSWTFVFVSVPMLIAYAQVRHIFFSFIGLFFLLFLPLVLLAGVLGTLVAFMLVRLWRLQRGWRWLALFAVACALPLVILIGFPAREPSAIAPMMSQLLDKMLSHTRFVQCPWWPSEWVSLAMMGFLKGNARDGMSFLWLLWITAAFCVQGLLLGGGPLLIRSTRWEIPLRAQKSRPHASLSWVQAFFAPMLGDEAASMIVKDIKTFARDPGQWSHFAIFFGLLAVYFFNLQRFHYSSMGPYWEILVTFLNLATVGLVSGTLSTRFFFPLPSLEIRRRWIWAVGSNANILWPKFVLGFLFLLSVTETLMLISCAMLHVQPWMTRVCLGADFCISMTMMGLALGLGAAFPDPKEEVSAKIVSGFGGTLCLILTLGYLVVVVLSLAIPIQLFVVHKAMSSATFATIMAAVGAGIVALSVGITMISLSAGHKSMRRSS